jgi:hypothetical protein
MYQNWMWKSCEEIKYNMHYLRQGRVLSLTKGVANGGLRI